MYFSHPAQDPRPCRRRRLTAAGSVSGLSALLMLGLAGCGVHTAALVSAKPRPYVACPYIADGCDQASELLAKPKSMTLSVDGTLYIKAITWHGWGAVTTTGTGTAYADNCKPNCAQGTFSPHPGTIVLSDPKPYHNELVYSHATDDVPAVHWQYTVTSGFVPSPHPAAPTPTTSPTPTAPPTPAPVSSQAALTSTCAMGYIPTGQGAVFEAGTPQGQTIDGTYYPPVPGYELTFTDKSGATADVTGFAVVFYDAQGGELGSDRENVKETFITAGQSLSWTEYSATTTEGTSDGFGNADIPSGAATCQMVAWYGPPSG